MKSFYKFLKEEVMTNLEETLRQKGYNDLKIFSRNKIAVLSDDNREEIFNRLLNDLREFNPARSLNTNHSSIGHIEIYPNSIVIVKPKSKQGMMSAGIDNELKLINTINNFIQQSDRKSIRVVFEGSGKKLVCDNVTSVEETGRKTKDKKKADAILNGDKDYGISIKKDNAEMWESADKYFKEKAKNVIKELVKLDKVKITKENDYYKIHPNIGVRATEEEAESVVFGSDIKENGAVIIKTFNDNDFKYNDAKEELTVKCSYVIQDLNDLPEQKKVYFLIRNNRTRRSKDFLPGLRILAVNKSRINPRVLKIKFS
jgi:hypothetical protein